MPEFPPEAFAKDDQTPATPFYAQPRLVTHIDDVAIKAVTDLFRPYLPSGGRILDLMSSRVSHLPADAAFAAVIGHGLNEHEASRQPAPDAAFRPGSNTDPVLPLGTASIDAALVCGGIQYLQDPVPVLRKVARVLVPGGRVVIFFSNRCFATKAVAI